jgi:hypothetical protein
LTFGRSAHILGGVDTASLVRQARWSVRARLAEHPAFVPIARLRHPRAAIAADTELVVDGFTRTATTFVVIAFQYAQERPVRIAHHLHAPGHIVAGARRGIPVLVTIRPPEGAAASCLQYDGQVTPAQVLTAYSRFYERIEPYLDRVVVADFGELTHDLGAVIGRINERFGTAFRPFIHTPESTEAVFELIDQRAARPPWGTTIGDYLSGLATLEDVRGAAARDDGMPEVPQERVQRPSSDRTAERERVATALRDPQLGPHLVRATRAYQRALAGSERAAA